MPAVTLPILERRISDALLATRRTTAHFVAAGEALIEAKELVAHGEWLAWLQDKFNLTDRTARRYMRVAQLWRDLDPENRTRVSDLAIRNLSKAFPARLRPPSSQHRIFPEVLATDFACPCGCGYEWSGSNPKPERRDGPLAHLIARLRDLRPEEMAHVAAFVESLRAAELAEAS
jgi:hypothetical protein